MPKNNQSIQLEFAPIYHTNASPIFLFDYHPNETDIEIKYNIKPPNEDMDNYYLNNAVYLMEDFLEGTTDPYYTGEVDYGDRAEHCWNGDHTRANAISRLRYNQMFIAKAVERMDKTSQPGADLTSWRY